MGSRIHARINAAIAMLTWAAAIYFLIDLFLRWQRLLPMMTTAPQEASLAANMCFQAIVIYAGARALEAVNRLSIKVWSKTASESGDERAPKQLAVGPTVET